MLKKLFKCFRRRPSIVVYKNGRKYRVNTMTEAYRLMTR